MSVVAPPPQNEPEALIPEARARQRKRWLGIAVLFAVLAALALGINAIVTGGGPNPAKSGGGPSAGVRSGKACGVRIDNMRIVDVAGNTIYREPGNWTPSYPHPAVVRCSGATDWVVWNNGAAMNQEGYVGVRSSDAGRTWHLVFAESYFGVNAPHQLDSYMGPWALRGSTAYFVGWCPVCGKGTVSFWVTSDGGRTFQRYKAPGLNGYMPVGLRISGRDVTISGKRDFRGVVPVRKTVTFHVA